MSDSDSQEVGAWVPLPCFHIATWYSSKCSCFSHLFLCPSLLSLLLAILLGDGPCSSSLTQLLTIGTEAGER